MIEKHSINGKNIWVKVDAHPILRENSNVIPTEYFTASCYEKDPSDAQAEGRTVKDENGEAMLFESPVAALSAARRHIEDAGRENRGPA